MIGNVGPMRSDDLLGFLDVSRRADKRQGNCVDAVIDPELQIFAIFFRQRGNRERDAREIDSLVLAKHASVKHVAENVFPADAANSQFNQAVAKQNASAGGQFARQVGKSGRDARRDYLQHPGE